MSRMLRATAVATAAFMVLAAHAGTDDVKKKPPAKTAAKAAKTRTVPATAATAKATLPPVTVVGQADPNIPADYRLGPGDQIKIQVFQQPDMTLEARVSESGIVNYPLAGRLQLGGLSIPDAETRVASALKKAQVLKSPQVNINLVHVRGSQVTVLGEVAKPGRFPLETMNTRVSDALAVAGGVAPGGDETVTVSGLRRGKPFRKEIDMAQLFANKGSGDDILLHAGDTVYVAKAPMYYIYGAAQKPGTYKLERGMTIMQAIAQSGGITPRGSDSRLKLTRKQPDGQLVELRPSLNDTIQAGDVLFVRESIF